MRRLTVKARALAALVLIASSASVAFAQDELQRIEFARGATSAIVQGHIAGYAFRDFVIRANAGQRMSVRITSKGSLAQFVIYSINGRATEDVERTEWTDTLPETGDYQIRVLMTRADARRRGAASDFALTVAIV
jgi:hypothetical protein